MLNCKRNWVRIADQEEENFCHIHAWQTDSEEGEGKTIAIVDLLTGRVFYLDQAARNDPMVQKKNSFYHGQGRKGPSLFRRTSGVHSSQCGRL